MTLVAMSVRPDVALAAPFPGTLSWASRADIPGGVTGAAGGVVADQLYVSHGFRGADSLSLDVYDVGTDSWSTGPDATVARSALAGAVLDGKFYAIGGQSGPSDVTEVFDPATSLWTTVASLNFARSGHAAVAVDGFIYVIGGRDGATIGAGNIVDATEVYDPVSDTWTQLSSMPLAVSDATATVGPDGLIYVMGGAVSPGTMTNALQIYDPVNDEWSFGASMPVRRVAMGSGVLCGQIVAFGGLDVEIGNLPATFLYDPADNTWSIGPDMVVAASAMAQGPTQTFGTIFSVGSAPFGPGSTVVQALSASCDFATPTPTAAAITATPPTTPTPSPTASATPIVTATTTAEPTASPTPSATATATASPTATETATGTPSATPTPTASETAVPTDTPTETPKPTDTPTATPLPTDTATLTPLPTTTATTTPLPTTTVTATPLPTTTATATPIATGTTARTVTPTATRTATPTRTPTPTRTVTPIPTPVNHPPDCSGAGPSSGELWPPNHKFVPVSIVGVTDPDGDPVTVTITSVTQDEPLNSEGDGNTCPDATNVGTSVVSVRSERSGLDDGRVYHLNFMASDGRGGTCVGTTGLCVPHDQRPDHVCGDQGPLYNSTGPCS